jgi:UDP-N-acetylglucosamine:LPS N-acetylglucosamine transferase
MAHAGAARLVLDQDLNGASLVKEVTGLAAEPGELERMGAAARAFAKPCAASRAREVLEGFVH